MLIRDSETELRRMLDERGTDLLSSTPTAAFEVMLDFYRDRRVGDVLSPEEDGDMLLFQWGTYDWGAGEAFEVSLTRQLLGEDDHLWQLQLIYRYPSAIGAHVGAGRSDWLGDWSDLGELRAFIAGSAAVSATVGPEPIEVTLRLELAG